MSDKRIVGVQPCPRCGRNDCAADRLRRNVMPWATDKLLMRARVEATLCDTLAVARLKPN